MVKYFIISCILFFAVIGICEFVYILRKLLFFPGVHTYNYSIIFLKRKYAIKQLRFFWQKLKWQGDEYAKEIIALTDNIDIDEIEICKHFTNGKNIILCNSNSINDLLKANKENF